MRVFPLHFTRKCVTLIPPMRVAAMACSFKSDPRAVRIPAFECGRPYPIDVRAFDLNVILGIL